VADLHEGVLSLLLVVLPVVANITVSRMHLTIELDLTQTVHLLHQVVGLLNPSLDSSI